MQIKPFIPDEKAVAHRANIQSFGLIRGNEGQRLTVILDKPPVFKTSDLFDTEDESESDKSAYVYKPRYNPVKQKEEVQGDVYVAPSKREEQITIKIINLPEEINRQKLESLIMDVFNLVPLSTYVVIDRDSGESRGYAYVSFSSLEKAKHAITAIDGHIIEHSILGAELAKH